MLAPICTYNQIHTSYIDDGSQTNKKHYQLKHVPLNQKTFKNIKVRFIRAHHIDLQYLRMAPMIEFSNIEWMLENLGSKLRPKLQHWHAITSTINCIPRHPGKKNWPLILRHANLVQHFPIFHHSTWSAVLPTKPVCQEAKPTCLSRYPWVLETSYDNWRSANGPVTSGLENRYWVAIRGMDKDFGVKTRGHDRLMSCEME